MGMKLLSVIDEWQDVLRNFKNSCTRCETNCYLSEQAITEYIDCGRLSYEIKDNTMWLSEHEQEYDILYYYVGKDKEVSPIIDSDRRQVIYLIGEEGRYRAENRERELILGGYKKYRKNLEYLVKKDKVEELEGADSKCSRFMKKFDFYYDWLKNEEEYQACYGLWSERIDKYSVKLALPSVVAGMIEDHESMLVRNNDGDIVAACQYVVGSNKGFSENIAVNEGINGTGIGAALLYHSILYIIKHGIDDSVFVWEENMESRRITERFGDLTGRFSQQLIR